MTIEGLTPVSPATSVANSAVSVTVKSPRRERGRSEMRPASRGRKGRTTSRIGRSWSRRMTQTAAETLASTARSSHAFDLARRARCCRDRTEAAAPAPSAAHTREHEGRCGRRSSRATCYSPKAQLRSRALRRSYWNLVRAIVLPCRRRYASDPGAPASAERRRRYDRETPVATRAANITATRRRPTPRRSRVHRRDARRGRRSSA
jgi:hypothetical protein